MKTVEIIFSPTGGTEKVARILTSRWELDTVTIDLSDAKADFSQCVIEKEDRVLIAMPSFGGRAPAVAIQRLMQIAGNGAKCTLVCVYGNRAYEDTLVEMEDAAKECGFRESKWRCCSWPRSGWRTQQAASRRRDPVCWLRTGA